MSSVLRILYQIFSTVGLRFRRRAYRPGIRDIALTGTGLDYLMGLSLREFEKLVTIIVERQKRRKYGK